MSIITQNHLNNKLTIISDKMSEVDTVSIVLGTKTGSRNENAENNGISHFLEHMAFKGTKTRDYKEIAEIVDNVGGSINAYTSKENTVYYIKLMKDDLELGVDILSDIFQNSIFLESEIEKERNVILQELSSSLDTPDDIVFDYFYETAFAKSKLGMRIIGTTDNIKSFQKNDFQQYISNRYVANKSVFSICGNFDHDRFYKLTEKYISNLPNAAIEENDKSVYSGGVFMKNKPELEQVQCVLGFKSIDYHQDDIYKIAVLSAILGNGMSSRLFQEIREKRGLAYTVSCWQDSYDDIGLFTLYAGTSPDKVDEFVSAARNELLKICENITDEEMQRVVKQNKAGIVMSKESTNSRAKKLCTDILNFNKYIPYDEIIEKINSITKKDIYAIAQNVFVNQNPTIALYGNLSKIKTNYEDFKVL